MEIINELSTLRDELFDAPSDVKASFNQVCQYFANASETMYLVVFPNDDKKEGDPSWGRPKIDILPKYAIDSDSYANSNDAMITIKKGNEKELREYLSKHKDEITKKYWDKWSSRRKHGWD